MPFLSSTPGGELDTENLWLDRTVGWLLSGDGALAHAPVPPRMVQGDIGGVIGFLQTKAVSGS